MRLQMIGSMSLVPRIMIPETYIEDPCSPESGISASLQKACGEFARPVKSLGVREARFNGESGVFSGFLMGHSIVLMCNSARTIPSRRYL
jgi:hypothetical protein